MSKAKTASKNNPTTRGTVKEMFFNGKKVKPVKFFGEMGVYIAIQYEDGTMPTDNTGNPLPWSATDGQEENSSSDNYIL